MLLLFSAGRFLIRYEPGPVAKVILDRSEKLNAQTWAMLREMEVQMRYPPSNVVQFRTGEHSSASQCV